MPGVKGSDALPNTPDADIPDGVVRIPDVVLTPDEQRECQEFISLVSHSSEGDLFVHPDVVEPMRRNFMAMAMMRRAERFAISGISDPEWRERACEAAAKASALYPTAVYVFDFAAILDECGHPGDATAMYREFLRRHAAGPLSPIDTSIEGTRDLEAMLAYASARVSQV